MQKFIRRPKHKISWRFAGIFTLLIVGILVFILVSNSFISKTYLYNSKIRTIKKLYERVETGISEGKFEDSDFKEKLSQMCSTNAIGMIIVDIDSQSLFFYGSKEEEMKIALWDKVFLKEKSQYNEVIEATEEYQIAQGFDDRTNQEYIEMWGVLSNDNLFLVRVAASNIQTTIEIMNKMLYIVAAITLLLGLVIITVLTRVVSKPILQLADISERMSHLDFDVKYEGKHDNEIGMLGENINIMSRALENTISELKTANNELKRDIERKEQLEEQRREFVSNVSHELKTPLAIIQGYAEGIMDGVSDDEESRNYYCSVIVDEATRMNELVRKLLEIQELESGTDTITMERFDIVSVINSRIKATEVLVKKDIRVEFDGNKPIYVWGDVFKIEEVFTNLLSNAINYCSGDKLIKISIEEREGVSHIEVFNTGEQIPKEHIEHVFEKFYKIDKARSREYGGSGIGLSIVKAIMDSMNQKVGVYNREDGVVFWFELDSDANI